MWPQLKLSDKIHKTTFTVDQHQKQIHARFNSFYKKEEPGLLHGDLWNGNFLIRQDGKPYLIDPATYYGHSEMDMAMTQLFGGFGT